jgi:hypothetical protein
VPVVLVQRFATGVRFHFAADYERDESECVSLAISPST